MTLIDIQSQLEAPFAIADIDLLPKGKSEQGGKVTCMALPYADVRVYEDRLNQLAPGEWSTPPPMAIVVGQKLVVYVSVIVCGIVHTDVGEAAAGGENAATESWAQGFKRACSQFGLGRYLYDLEKAWVPYNAQRKQIDLKPAEIQAVVRKMYSAARIGVSTPATPTPIDAGKTTVQNVPTLKQRLNSAYDKALALSLIEKGKTSEESGITFLKWAAGVLGDIQLTNSNQLNAQRLDTIEAYLNSQDAA